MSKKCSRCRVIKDLAAFARDSTRKDGRCHYCRQCSSMQQAELHWRHPQRYLWTFARRRAKCKGLPFSIVPEDIMLPERCPVCGIMLVHAIGKGRKQAASSSLDRVEPHQGYVVGNIAVMCSRCNTIKTDATVEELERLAKWLSKVTKIVTLEE